MNGWIIAIGVAGFLQVLGKFLDEYHISSKTKDKARLLLVRAFVALDSISVPDFPGRVLEVTLRSNKNLTTAYLLVLFITTLLASLFSIGILATLSGEFALAFVFTSAFLFGLSDFISVGDYFKILYPYVMLLFLPLLFLLCLRFLHGYLRASRWNFLRIVSPLFSVITIVSVVLCLFYILYVTELLEDYFTIGLVLSVLMPILMASVLVVFLFLIKIVLVLVQQTALLLFSGASDPQGSPFSYAAALLAVLVLVAEGLQKLLLL